MTLQNPDDLSPLNAVTLRHHGFLTLDFISRVIAGPNPVEIKQPLSAAKEL